MRTIHGWRSAGSQPHPHIRAFGLQTFCERFTNHSARSCIQGLIYGLHQKKLLIKVVWNWILYKKVCERICLSPPRMELWTQKIDIVEILYCTERANYIQFRAKCCRKYVSHQKKIWIKVGIEFRTKKVANAYLYLPQSGVRGLKRLIWLKYYIVLKGKIIFNLEQNAAKNMHRIKKSFE